MELKKLKIAGASSFVIASKEGRRTFFLFGGASPITATAFPVSSGKGGQTKS